MANNELTKISTALLPLNDLATIMNAKYGFIKENDRANDVMYVGTVPSEQIAVAVSLDDRETVRNSLKLGGIAATDYMQKAEGAEISATNSVIKSNFSKDIMDMRDELTQLRMELAKKGVVSGYKPYAGFYDMFLNGAEENVKDIIASSISDSVSHDTIIVSADKFGQFEVDDYIVLYFKTEDSYHVCQLVEKNTDGMTLKLTPSTAFNIVAGNVDIYKSIGCIDEGAYSFCRKASDQMDTVEMHSGLNDDTYFTDKKIITSQSGFGYSFRIPASQQGFLTKLNVMLKTNGTPGALMCYVVEEKDVAKFANPTQAAQDGILKAKSQPLMQSASFGRRLASFSFWDGTKYPLFSGEGDSTRYVFIIEALSANIDAIQGIDNSYELRFLQTRLTDGTMGNLQLNNTTYNYTRKTEVNAEDPALTTNSAINAFDMYYGIVTRAVIDETIVPFREAVYTAKFDVPEGIALSNARMAMHIAREGYYVTDNASPAAFLPNSSIAVAKEVGLADLYDMNELGGFGLRVNDEDVIVGPFIRRVSSQNASSVVIKDGVYLEPKTPVYRAGYKVYLKAWKKTLNKETGRYEVSDYARIELPLTAVVPDVHKSSAKMSDRLLYETSNIVGLEDTRYFNSFEVQIYWHTEYGAYYQDDKYKTDFVGRIHDLSLSFNRGV